MSRKKAKKGSKKTKVKSREPASWKASLRKKSEQTGIPYDILDKVMRRGMAAWRTGHRPGVSQVAWGLARVNSFAVGGKTYWTTDRDLARDLYQRKKLYFNDFEGKLVKSKRGKNPDYPPEIEDLLIELAKKSNIKGYDPKTYDDEFAEHRKGIYIHTTAHPQKPDDYCAGELCVSSVERGGTLGANKRDMGVVFEGTARKLFDRDVWSKYQGDLWKREVLDDAFDLTRKESHYGHIYTPWPESPHDEGWMHLPSAKVKEYLVPEELQERFKSLRVADEKTPVKYLSKDKWNDYVWSKYNIPEGKQGKTPKGRKGNPKVSKDRAIDLLSRIHRDTEVIVPDTGGGGYVMELHEFLDYDIEELVDNDADIGMYVTEQAIVITDPDDPAKISGYITNVDPEMTGIGTFYGNNFLENILSSGRSTLPMILDQFESGQPFGLVQIFSEFSRPGDDVPFFTEEVGGSVFEVTPTYEPGLVWGEEETVGDTAGVSVDAVGDFNIEDLQESYERMFEVPEGEDVREMPVVITDKRTYGGSVSPQNRLPAGSEEIIQLLAEDVGGSDQLLAMVREQAADPPAASGLMRSMFQGEARLLPGAEAEMIEDYIRQLFPDKE